MRAARQIAQNRAGRSRNAGVLLALIIGGASVLLQAVPSLAGSLQWSRLTTDASPAWRWLTGHLVHWSWNQLQWDLLAFALLSFMGLRLLPERYTLCLALAGALIPLELRIHQPQLESYRGLSGIDSALFGLMIAGLWRHSIHGSRTIIPRVLALTGGCAFLAKTLFELRTGGTLFVTNERHEFVPVISAHLTGFVSGLIAASGSITARDQDAAATSHPAARSRFTCRLRFLRASR